MQLKSRISSLALQQRSFWLQICKQWSCSIHTAMGPRKKLLLTCTSNKMNFWVRATTHMVGPHTELEVSFAVRVPPPSLPAAPGTNLSYILPGFVLVCQQAYGSCRGDCIKYMTMNNWPFMHCHDGHRRKCSNHQYHVFPQEIISCLIGSISIPVLRNILSSYNILQTATNHTRTHHIKADNVMITYVDHAKCLDLSSKGGSLRSYAISISSLQRPFWPHNVTWHA